MKEIAWEIGETYRVLRRHYNRRAAALGVTTAQWRALAWIGHQQGLKQVELAERLDVEPITAARIIDKLEESGLVERRPDPADRRAWRLMMTDKAKPIYERLTDLAVEMADEALVGFAHEDMVEMRARLALIRDNVSRAEGALRTSA